MSAALAVLVVAGVLGFLLWCAYDIGYDVGWDRRDRGEP